MTDYRGGKTIPDPAYSDSRIYLYGVPVDPWYPLPGAANIVIQPQAGNGAWEIAIIYGYGYQGHCYNLPRPSLYVVNGSSRQEATGCHFGDDYRLMSGGTSTTVRYSMWVADKLDPATQIEIRNDTFDALLLQANLPTNKQPSAYHIAAMMGHRSGKLTE